LAIVFWFFQLAAEVWTDKGTLSAWAFRGLLIAGMVLSALIAVIRFVKWVWQG